MQTEVCVTDNLKVECSIVVNKQNIASKVTERKCVYDSGRLFKRKDCDICDLAVEFSKAFGDVKGLDDFIMNIINNLSSAENIMKAKNIGELSDEEMIALEIEGKSERTNEIESKMPKEFIQKEKEESEKNANIERVSSQSELSVDISSVGVSSVSENIIDQTKSNRKEKEWEPEVPPDQAPLNLKEYIPEAEKTEEASSEETRLRKKPSTDKSRASTTSAAPTSLSEKDRKNIGRWGEEHALYIIVKEKLEEILERKIEENTFEDIRSHYADVIKETEEGFKLEKDGNVVEVKWLNKNGEQKCPYDITIEDSEEKIFIEVKSTKDDSKSWFEISKDQWRFMEEKADRFYIYRVYGVGTDKPRVEKIHNPAKLWKDGKINAHPVKIEL